MLSRWHDVGTGIGSKRIDEETFTDSHRPTSSVESNSIARCGCRRRYPTGHNPSNSSSFRRTLSSGVAQVRPLESDSSQLAMKPTL